MTFFTHDVAISAVPYDALLVAGLSQQLQPSLASAPFWRQDADDARTDLASDDAMNDWGRVALVLHQRLWGHERQTRMDALALKERARAKVSRPIVVATLDDEPVPPWLAGAAHCSLASAGVAGVAARVLHAMRDIGKSSHRQRPYDPPGAAAAPPAEGRAGWHDAPIPFLAQTRAFSSLKREFDALAMELSARVPAGPKVSSDRNPKLHCAPNRIVVQLGTVALSFSWVAARSGAVADGRLLVIEWEGIVAHSPGPGDLRTASPKRERSFVAHATGPTDWCWRAEDAEANAYSTRNLAGQALDGALIEQGAA